MTNNGNRYANRVGDSLPQLKAKRRRALGLMEEAEASADRLRLQAEMYSDAAQELGERALTTEGMVKELEGKAEAQAAKEKRDEAQQLRALSERSRNKAEEQVDIAMIHAREAIRQKELAARLKEEIDLRGW